MKDADALYNGLDQLTTEGLRRALNACKEHPERMVFNGMIVDSKGKY